MPTVSTAKLTARQFLMLGDDPPGVRLELVDGEIAVSPSPRPPHSHVDRQLSYYLVDHVKRHDLGIILGDVDTIFGEYEVRRPDLLYFRKDRMHLVQADDAIVGPPDLCVEIVSPSRGAIDRKDKCKQYAEFGVPYYWIVDPHAQTIEAFRLSGGRYRACGRGQGDAVVSVPPFPELQIPLGQIWFPTKRK